MKVLKVAGLLFLLLPFSAFAQTEPAKPLAGSQPGVSGGSDALFWTVTVVGTAIIADVLTRGALSGPLLRTVGLAARPTAAVGTTGTTSALRAAVSATPAVIGPAAAPVIVAVPVAVQATPTAISATAPARASWWRFW